MLVTSSDFPFYRIFLKWSDVIFQNLWFSGGYRSRFDRMSLNAMSELTGYGLRRPLNHLTLCDRISKIDIIINCMRKMWCFHSVIHNQFQWNAWCTKGRAWMSPESKIPGLLFTTSFNVMPGVLSDGSGCRLSQKLPVCYYGLNIDCDFIWL